MKPWSMFLICKDDLTKHEADRLIERAGVMLRIRSHETEAEARSAAEGALRKLKAVTDHEWIACYAEPFTEMNFSSDRVPRVVRSGDLDD